MLPGALVMGIMSPITGKLFDKFGPRILATIGLTITAVATYFLTRLEVDSSYTYIISVYTIRMLGISLVMMPIMTNGLNAIPQRLNAHGTAINNTISQISGSIGTAILVTIFNSHTKLRATEIGAEYKEKYANLGVTPTDEQIMQMTEAVGQQALLDGINFSFLVATGITIVAWVLTFFLKRASQPKEPAGTLEK